MAGESTLETQVSTVALKPSNVSNDSVSVTQQPLGALIEADKYTTAKRAARNGNGFGIRVFNSTPGAGRG